MDLVNLFAAGSFIETWNHFHYQVALIVVFIFIFLGLDDFLLDMGSYLRGARPKKLLANDLKDLANKDQKPIAIMIPAWDESEVITAVLEGNIRGIQYDNYHIFVGVYPNDLKTIDSVKAVTKKHAHVHYVMNPKLGPTSKGQMLNHVIRYILEYEGQLNTKFSAVLMQDSEDVIHPLALQLGNRDLDKIDFIQIPVFSLPLPKKSLVGGTYQDEFAELHTKDLLVRSFSNGGVPSAGVGTFIGRKVFTDIFRQKQAVFAEDSLTEDYELGLTATIGGGKGRFLCCYFEDEKTKNKEFIATREYFPKKFSHSIRQKTRWNLGIIFQGWSRLGWQGSLMQKYFLYRDRKGLFTHFFSVGGYLLALSQVALLGLNQPVTLPQWFSSQLIFFVQALAIFLMVNRFLQRVIGTYLVYGPLVMLFVPIRWPVAAAINFCSIIKAIFQMVRSQFTGKSLAWSKTQHEVPAQFLNTQSIGESQRV